MPPEEEPIGGCDGIDDESIERYLMGRLEQGSTRQHLETCELCKDRVAEYRDYLDSLKRGLEE